jgi:hypothetical protein
MMVPLSGAFVVKDSHMTLKLVMLSFVPPTADVTQWPAIVHQSGRIRQLTCGMGPSHIAWQYLYKHR